MQRAEAQRDSCSVAIRGFGSIPRIASLSMQAYRDLDLIVARETRLNINVGFVTNCMVMSFDMSSNGREILNDANKLRFQS